MKTQTEIEGKETVFRDGKIVKKQTYSTACGTENIETPDRSLTENCLFIIRLFDTWSIFKNSQYCIKLLTIYWVQTISAYPQFVHNCFYSTAKKYRILQQS